MREGRVDRVIGVLRTGTGNWATVGLTVVAGLILVPTDAVAQRPLNRVIVVGTVGFGSFWGPESRVGSGPLLGGGVRFEPWTHWGMEVDLRHYRHSRRFESGVVFVGDGLALTASVTYSARMAAARPFVRAGVGVLRWTRESRFPISQGPGPGRPARPSRVLGAERVRSTGAAVGLSLGGGVDVRIDDRWSVRPEAHALVGAGTPVALVDVGAGLGYAW